MLTSDEKNRYARHLLLPGFGPEAQLRLKNSKALLIGAGGLGSPAALYLTAAGIGHLTIIDSDTVELSNLQRQILHNEGEVGKPKVDSALRRLSILNSQTTLEMIKEDFSLLNATQLVKSHDLVIDGSDNFPTRFLVNDACYLEKTPLVYGSIFQYEGQLTFFNSSVKGPCYRCIVPTVPDASAVPNCTEAGVIGTLAGVIGSLQSMEAVKYLAGIGTPPIGKMLYYNAWETNFREIRLNKDPLCPLCSDSPTIKTLTQESSASCSMTDEYKSITAKELHLLMDNDPDLFLIDVREPTEFAEQRIPGSHLIPLKTLKDNISALPMDRDIYIHCQSGLRSAQALTILHSRGFKFLINIKDGINGWANANGKS